MKLTDKQKADLRKHMEGHGGTVKEKASHRRHLIRRMATGMSLKKAKSDLGAKKFVDKNKGKPPSKMKNPVEPETLMDAGAAAYPGDNPSIAAYATRALALTANNNRGGRGQVFEAARSNNNDPPAFLLLSVRRNGRDVQVNRERINEAIQTQNDMNDPLPPIPAGAAGRGRGGGRGRGLRRMNANNRGGRGGNNNNNNN